MYHETGGFSEQTARLVAPHGRAPEGIELLDSCITQARRRRFSNGIEAVVRVTFRDHPARPLRSATLLVSLPRHAGSRPGTLRRRMTGMALDLALLMERGAAPPPI